MIYCNERDCVHNWIMDGYGPACTNPSLHIEFKECMDYETLETAKEDNSKQCEKT